MVDVRTEILINRPVAEVADYAVHPDNVPVWYNNIKEVEWQTPKPLQIGSRIAFIAQFMFRKLYYIYEVTDWIPGKLFTMQTAEGPFPMQTTYSFFPINDSTTKMTLRNIGEPSGFSILMTPLLTWMMRKANNKDLEKLKSILEKT